MLVPKFRWRAGVVLRGTSMEKKIKGIEACPKQEASRLLGLGAHAYADLLSFAEGPE